MDLVGELVRLRAPRPADAASLQAIETEPEVARFAGTGSLMPTTVEQIRETLGKRVSPPIFSAAN